MRINELYKATGCIGMLSWRRRGELEIIVEQIHKPEVAPHLLKVSGPLADYLESRSGTDAEERYIDSVYYFDSFCELCMIEIPARKREDGPNLPAKIIGVSKEGNFTLHLTVFGPSDWIDTPNPEPMSVSEYHRFLDWSLSADRI